MLQVLPEIWKFLLIFYRFEHFWGGALLVLPFFHWVKWGPRLSQQMLFTFLVFLSLCLFGKGKVSAKFPSKTIILFMFFAFFNQHTETSLNVLLQWLPFLAGCALLFQANGQLKDIKIIYSYMFLAGLAHSSWIFLNYLGVDPLDVFLNTIGKYKRYVSKQGMDVKVMGPFLHHNLSGAFIALSIPTFFQRKTFIAVPIAALVLLNTSMATISVVVGTLVYVWSRFNLNFRRLYISLFGGASLLFALTYYKPTEKLFRFFYDNGRLSVWYDSLTWLSGIWIFIGKGLGYFPDQFHKSFRYDMIFLQAHSEYVETYVAFGIIGVVLLLRTIIISIKNTNDSILLAIIACLCTNMVGNFTIHIAGLAIIGILCFSYSFREEEYGSKRDT